jgi:hypothetical protein
MIRGIVFCWTLMRPKVDDLHLSEVMSALGSLRDDLEIASISCDASVFVAAKMYRDSLNIDDIAQKVYLEKISGMQSKVVQFLQAAETSEVDLEDTICASVQLDRILQLTSWSETPQHDRTSLDMLKSAMYLVSHAHEAESNSSGSIALKNLPAVLCEAYKAGKQVVHAGADAVIPKFTFLTGDPEMAVKMFKKCHRVSQSTDTCMNALVKAVQEGLDKAEHLVEKAAPEVHVGAVDFESDFKVDKCEAAHKAINGAISKAEILVQKCGVGIDLHVAKNARLHARGCINRSALAQLVSRANISHLAKGKPLRAQLKAVWDSVNTHGLSQFIPQELQELVEGLLPSEADEQASEVGASSAPAAGSIEPGSAPLQQSSSSSEAASSKVEPAAKRQKI